MNELNQDLLKSAGGDGASVDDAGYLSPAEFALLARISESTVRRRLDSGDIPSIQPGGPRCRVLIPKSALDVTSWASRHRAGGDQPLESDFDVEAVPSADEPPRIPGPRPRWQQKPR